MCFGGTYALQRALGMLQYLPNAPCRGLLPLHGLNAFQALLNDNEPLCYRDIRVMVQMQFETS